MRQTRLLVVVAFACRTPAAVIAPVESTTPATSSDSRVIVDDAGEIRAMARDATHLYWIADEGVFRRPLGGPGAGAVEQRSDGVGATIATLDAVHALAFGDDGRVHVATDKAVLQVPADGADPVTLASSQTRVVGLAASGGHVYWIEAGAGEHDPGAIRRVDVRGGKVEELATGLDYVRGLAVVGDRVYWASELDGVSSIATSGGPIRDELGGAAQGVAAGGGGLIARFEGGLVIDRGGDGRRRVRMVPDGTWYPDAQAMVATDDWLYLAAFDDASHRAILAIPRDDAEVELAFRPEGDVGAIRAAAGALYWTEIGGDEDAGYRSHVMRGDPATGATHELGVADDWHRDLVIDDDQIYVTDEDRIYRLPTGGGAFTTLHTIDPAIASYPGPVALTRHGDQLYWAVDGGLYAIARSSGRGAMRIASNAADDLITSSDDADLVFHGDDIYLTAFDLHGVSRIDQDGAVTSLWPAGEDIVIHGTLVEIGGALHFHAWNSDPYAESPAHTIYRLSFDGAATSLYRAPGNAEIDELVSGGGLLYALVRHDDDSQLVEIVRVDPATGTSEPVLRWENDSNLSDDGTRIGCDDTGFYVLLSEHDAILRLGHQASAVR